MLLKTTLVPIFVTLSYTVSFLLVALLIIARLTIQRILRSSITTTVMPISASSTGSSTSTSSSCSRVSISSSSYENRQQVWEIVTLHSKEKTIPRTVKAWLLLASDRPIFLYLLVGILWLVTGPWVVGHFPDEFGVMMLWGMWFFPSTENGKFTQWLDCSMWATGYLLSFILMIVYFCIVMPPPSTLSSSSPSLITYHTEFGVGMRWMTHALAWGLFVGAFLVVKLKIIYGSFPTWTLILSPVHTVIPAFVIPLLIRETVFEVKRTFVLEKEKRKEEERVDMETIAVHQTM